MQATPLLQLRGVSKSFGRVEVLKDVDLAVATGSLYGIVGPNGAGKSTLFNVVSGDLRADSGTLTFDGESMTRQDPAQRARAGIGRTYQIPRPFAGMTVFENALVAAQQAGVGRVDDARSSALEAIDRTGLSAYVNDSAGSLRLLDRKRLEVARVIAANPSLVLLDEVAGGLTEAEVHELLDIIRDLKSQGLTIVWIEHVVHALLAVADELMCLTYGKVLLSGDPAEVMASDEVREVYLGGAPEEGLIEAMDAP
jgi:branched-chain amino acid transport system ATP-binding protein